jgi:hypothetical protein
LVASKVLPYRRVAGGALLLLTEQQQGLPLGEAQQQQEGL